MQAAQLNLLSGIANAIKESKGIDNTLQDVLATCLDASGISKGILFLMEESGKPVSHQIIGYSKNEKNKLDNYFEQEQLFKNIMNDKQIIQIPSPNISTTKAKQLLKNIGVNSALFIPLISGTRCHGLLFIGSTTTKVTESGLVIFAKSLSSQLAQSIALTTTFESLVESENRYRTLMNNASCGIIVIKQSGEILEVNKQIELLLGRSRDKIIGNHFNEFVIGEENKSSIKYLEKLSNKSVAEPSELLLRKDDGAIHNIKLTVAKIDMKKEKIFLIVINDVTERNQLKAQAMKNDRLTMVGTLAEGVAHEINNPIAWILANLSYLKNESIIVKDKLSLLEKIEHETDVHNKIKLINELSSDLTIKELIEKFDEMIQESLQGAERIHGIVKNLKGFSRVEETEMTLVDIHEIIESVINMSYPQFKYRARLEKNFSPNLPKLMSNDGKLHQVFLNIILNAAHSRCG